MPEVVRNIETFNGDRANAKIWLDTLISAGTLHQLPDSYLLTRWSKIVLYLYTELKLSFSETKEQILIGLHSQALCDAMWSNQHHNSDDLLQDLYDYLEVDKRRVEKRSDNSGMQASFSPSIRNTPIPRAAAIQQSATVGPRINPGIKCFNCGLHGHLKAECRRPIRVPGLCFLCETTQDISQILPKERVQCQPRSSYFSAR
nr:unnamed protein product [Callosobruchus analis]